MSETNTQESWLKLKNKLVYQNQAWIDGQWHTPTGGETYAVTNPATGEVIVNMAACQQDDVDLAVAAAKRTFDAGVWSMTSPAHRKAVLKKLADLIKQNTNELALLESLNMGKPVADALSIDIPGSAACIEWYAEAIDKIYGDVAPTDANNIATITREPIGVIGAVVPWNFPLDIAVWKIAPALITGNSIVLKPAEESPHTVLKLAELAKEAGLPDGVLNIVTGVGAVTGRALGLHNDVDCLVFTGSTATGKRFLKYSAESNMKQVWPETGGKSPNLIFADCDLEKAVTGAINGIFFNQGEVCSANSRILVDNKIKAEFIDAFIKAAEKLVLGDPLDPKTQVGAIIDQAQVERMLAIIDRAKKQGAKLVLGGNTDKTKRFLYPTIFDQVTPSMEVATEEIFGPVAVVIGFDTEEEAIKIANDSIYGLAASVWSNNLSLVYRVSRRLRVGTVSVNTVDALDFSTPFGGYKQSGFGRDLSLYALDKFTQLKTTWIKLS
ncbi:aldehyde dehydrogenase [Psychromonas sp. SR45-3]|uniref:aldehyde dehydrogenase n=1 Tax=Psychromonas sp. SR45-3 TaxID=2760930 RepID=UPI0015FA99A8|nr:aldehyde dehydrogenase [Psychromonas sp. SR45-3]MBB1271349.1 aldehyde dehydrogenase [Psychromonas sp. SR45-3]